MFHDGYAYTVTPVLLNSSQVGTKKIDNTDMKTARLLFILQVLAILHTFSHFEMCVAIELITRNTRSFAVLCWIPSDAWRRKQ